MMKKLIVLISTVGILIALSTSQVFAQNNNSVATPSGNWWDSTTWQANLIPDNNDCFDSVVIATTVYIDNHITMGSCSTLVIAVEDTLRFKSGFKMTLPEGSHIWVGPNGYVYPEGTGNSNIITIGTTEYWRSSDGPISGTTILDVSYTEINVSHKNGKTTIRWATASETNNDYFIVEESTNGVEFYEVGKVQGAGNSHSLKHYKFELSRNPDVPYYYRLTQVDFDGTRSISEVLPLMPENVTQDGVQMWSDRKSLEIRIPDVFQAQDLIADFVDGSGKTMYSVPLSHDESMSIDLSHMHAGIYYCVVRSSAEVIASKSVALY